MGTELEDYTTYIKTQDSIFLQFHTSSDVHSNYSIASEGFGTEACHLAATNSSEMFNLAWQVEFVVDNVCSVHALSQSEGKIKTKRAVLYGNAIKLKHSHSDKFLSCQGKPWNRDKLSYKIHLQQEDNKACWFVVVPGQVTRSEGEKVRFGDDVLLRSISFDRYLCADMNSYEDPNSSPMTSPGANFWMNLDDMESPSFVIASFKKTLWCLQLFTSNVAREQDIGFLCGQESVQFFCRHTTSYLMACSEEEDKEGEGHGQLKFEPTDHKNEVLSIWRIELLQLKWGGLHLQWGQPFRLRHMVTGKFLGSRLEDKNRYSLVLLSEEESNYGNSVFSLRRSVEDVSHWEQREDQFFKPQIKLGDSMGLLQHFPGKPGARGVDAHPLWLGFTTGVVEESRSSRPAMFLSQGINYKYALTTTTTSTEKSKGAVNVYITDRIINTFKRIVSQKPLHAQFVPTCRRLIEILKEFSSHFDKFTTHEGLFKSFLSLASDVETIYKNSFTAGPPKLSHARLSRGSGSPSTNIKDIKFSLLKTLAQFLKHNPECSRYFSQPDNLKLFLSMVEDPKYNREVLTVLLNAFHENSEILNSFKEAYIERIIMLFSSFGRNEKILELLTSLCLCNGTAIRRNQNVICHELLGKSSIHDLLLRTTTVKKIHVMRTSFCISRHSDSATYPKWYYELELEHPASALSRDSAHFRVGWIALEYFSDLPFYDSSRRGEGTHSEDALSLSEGGVGDDLYSYGFDGRYVWTGGIPFRSSSSSETADFTLTKSVIGCYIDLSEKHMRCWFSLNGQMLEPRLTCLPSSQMVCPAVSFSSDLRCHFRLGDEFGGFIHTPDSEFVGIASARSPNEDESPGTAHAGMFCSASAVSIPPGGQTEGANSFRIEGPAAIDDDCSFVPTPIDVSDMPPSPASLTQPIAEYLHDVWAVNKIESGWDFAEQRNDGKKLHPLLIPFSEMFEEQKKYDLDLGQETIKTLKALGYDMKAPSKGGFRAKKKPLDPETYQLKNGYLPSLYNLDALEELPALHDMIERLAENAHNLWARSKVSNGFCYGSSAKNASLKVSPYLVPYERLGSRDKKSNRDSVKGVIEALIARGYSILSMRSDHEILELARNVDFSSIKTITYRTQSSYGVSEGLWYYDVTLETAGFIRIGWAASAFKAGRLLGSDADSYAYDGYLARKWNKNSVTFGQRWKSGDRIRCFLNLKEGTICFACNDSLLRGTGNDTIAFSDLPRGDGFKYYPAVSLGRGQRVEISFMEGKEMKIYELVDEYSPFSTGVHTSIPLWYSLEDCHYEPISSPQSAFCLSKEVDLLVINEMSVQLKSLPQDVLPECLRLNLGVPLKTRSPGRKDNLICFGVRVQVSDIGKAYLGWTTSSFKFFPGENSHSWGQECTVSGDPPTLVKTAYLMPLSKLTEKMHQEEHLEVYTVLDRDRRVITYHFSYDSECKGESFELSPTVIKLFPTFIISPSKQRVFDFLLEPLTDRSSLASAILPPGRTDNSRSHYFAWMELQAAVAYSWTYRENYSVNCCLERAGDGACTLVHEDVPSSPTGTGGGSLERLTPSVGARKLVKMHRVYSSFESTDAIGDRCHSLYVLVPEEETLFRFTDISERPVLAKFLTQSLRLFNAICYHVFSSAVDSVQAYVTKETLLAMMSLALKFYLPNDLKISIYDLYITLNFEKESMCALWTRDDFVFAAEFPDDPSPYLPTPGRGLFSAQASFYSDFGDDSVIDTQYHKFKRFIFSKLNEVLLHKEYACRSLTHQDHVGLFVPILRIIKHMLLTDQLADEEMNKLIYLLDPSRSSVNIGSHLKTGGDADITGLLNIENLEESVKYEICIILDYMCDRELKDKIRVLVEFSGSMAYKLRAEQEQKHKQLEEQLKQSPSFAMQKTKQFRLRPLAQVCEMLGVNEEGGIDAKDTNELREEVKRFHRDLLFKFDVEQGKMEEGELRSFLERHPSQEDKQSQLRALNSIIKDTLRGWVDSEVQEPKLVCAIFNLLHRQFHEQEEFSSALEKTYILPASKQTHNLISPTDILSALGHLRSLMEVRIDTSEQKSLKRYLNILSEPRLVFHHPELLCSLQIHETVLNVMKHLLDDIQSKEQNKTNPIHQQTTDNFKIFQETISECCKYLCNLAKFSGGSNSKYAPTNSQCMLFPHLDYLLELSRVHNTVDYQTDTSPMEVANAIIRNNERLALCLQEEQIRKVIDLLAHAVSDLHLLNRTEQYLEFLKLAVRSSDCYIEENAKIIVTHLISNRMCLGPALEYNQPNGFGGYFTSLSSPTDDSLSAEVTLPYYISLLDLLAKCAPDHPSEALLLSETPPICSVLQKIIVEEDLRRLLECSLEPPERFEAGEFVELKNKKFAEEWSNFKGSILLFYEQVHSIDPATILALIEASIIPDMLYTLCLCRVDIDEVAVTLLKYITQSVIPFLHRAIASMPTDSISDALSSKLLHANYWLACLPVAMVQKNQVSEFVRLIASRLTPGTMYPLLSKLLLDMHHLPPHNRGIVINMLRVHFTARGGYYSGANIDSTNAATPQEQHQLLELAHFLLEETYASSRSPPSKMERKSSSLAQKENNSARLRECLHAVIHALAPDMLVPEHTLSDTSFLLLPNHHLHLASSSVGTSHPQILPSFDFPSPSALLGPDSRLSPPSDLIQRLKRPATAWLDTLQYRLYCQEISGVIADKERIQESVDSTISLLLNAIMSKGIYFVHNPLHNGQTDTYSSKDFLSVIKNSFNIGLTKKDLRDKTWKQLMRSVSLAVLEFSSLLSNHLHFRSKSVREQLVPIPYYLLQTQEQEIIVEAVYEFFNLISNSGYKLQTTKQSSMSVDQTGENFGRQTVTLLVVHELYESFRGRCEKMQGSGAKAYLRDILLPVITNYFWEHRSYFVSDANQLVYMSMASQFELVEVAKLFHFIILYLHKNPDLFEKSAATQREIRTALEWLCRCIHPFASNISVGNIVSEDMPELTETDSSNAVNYIEDVISILIHSLQEQPPSSLTAVLPVISVLVKQIGSIRENAGKLHGNLAQVELDRRLTELYRSLSARVDSTHPRDLAAYGECLTAICCTRVSPLLEENFGEAVSLYQSIRARVLTASLQDEAYVHISLPLITRYIKRCNDLKTEDRPRHNSDIQPILCSVIRYLRDNMLADIPEEYHIVQCLELIAPYTPLEDLWSVWRDLKLYIHTIRTALISLWKSEQRLTAAEAGSQYNEMEHSNLEPQFNILLPHLLSALMLLGRFLYSREKDLLATAQEHAHEHISLFWDLDFIFNCWQTSQYARQGLQGIIHTICNKFEGTETPNLLSDRNELSILLQLVLQTQKKVYNERCHILVYCVKTHLDLILHLKHFSALHEVIESSENMFRTNNNIEYISQKLDQEYADKHKSLSLSNSRSYALLNWYHLPQSDSQNALKMDLMEIGRIKAAIYNLEHPRAGRDRWRKFLTQHKKRAIMRSFQSVPIYKLPWFKISNHFLETYRSKWLSKSHKEADLITQLEATTQEGPGAVEGSKPLKLLVGVFCQGGIQQTDQQELYRKYAKSLQESCDCINDDPEGQECDDIFAQQAKKKELEKQQVELTNRNVAEMVVVVLAESDGCRGELIQETLQLGISLLKGGNLEVQENILEFLQTSKEGGDFFTSMSRLIFDCPVLDRSTYERQRKVYGNAEDLQTAIKDDQFTQDLFRFLQLLCEGHNMSMQNYLRSQQDKTTTVNLVVSTVDYLLSLQESIQNFYGQYAGPGGIDVQGQSNFKKVFMVVQQVFNTLTEYVQGPCNANQQALSQSRLWDAISGFFYIFAKLQSKLSSEYEYSMELMKEVLDVHADMIILLLSMLEGNVNNEANSISGQMKDALVESRQNLKEIVEFCCTFIDLNDVITSKGFQSYDQNKDGVVSRIEFETALSSQNYKQSDMDYLMRCADTNQDGVIDYMEFMERFYTPCDRIGFNLSVLFTILFDHLFEGDTNQELGRLRDDTEKLRKHFKSYTGCIEIIGKSKKVEKVFFQIDKSNFEQWEKPQIQESKRNFIQNLDHEISTKDKMEKFMDFCEDTIFEMKHAAMLSQSLERERETRACEHHENAADYFKMVPTDPVEKLAVNYKVHVDEARNKWARAKIGLSSFYSKLGLLKFILVVPILVEFCINIASFVKQRFYPTQGSKPNAAVTVDSSYVPRIIGATRRFSSNLAQMDFLLRKSSMVIVFVLNLLLLFCNFDALSGSYDDSSSIVFMNFTVPETLDRVKVFLLHSTSSLHLVFSGLLIWTYWKLKFPLIVFREEKSLCHAIEGNKEKLKNEFNKCMFLINKRWWDKQVLSSATFPQHYWNKLVRQEMKEESDDKESNGTFYGFDINYTLWTVVCVMLTDYTLQIKVVYFLFSLLGKLYSPAFFCIHLLLDVYTNFETLRTIFYSIYHNKTRLLMSIFILLVVQLIFSIIGMYLFGPEDEVSLIDIFLYLVGQIPGGNLDISEKYQPDNNTLAPKDTTVTVYSIAYFFAIQLVLIALIQGLIIDAFGELRKKQEDAKVAMHNKCFICGLTKETFDQNTPRGFEMHTEKEHYFPNYLFFLMHLIHKEETEYTGQESYVMDMYRKRDWEFFPVGTCFSQHKISENK